MPAPLAEPRTDLEAVFFAINDYPRGATLRGCRNDERNFRAVLEPRGYRVTSLLDRDATRDNILELLKAAVARVGPTGALFVGYSGHGMRQGNREAWVDVNLKPVYDAEVLAALAAVHSQGRITAWSDSCYGAGMAKGIPIGVEHLGISYRSSKYLAADEVDLEAVPMPSGQKLSGARRRVRRKPVLWLTAAKATEVTWDADVASPWPPPNGPMTVIPQGCFTWAGLQALRDLGPTSTNRDWYRGIRRRLPSDDFDNTPQTDGPGGDWHVLAATGRR